MVILVYDSEQIEVHEATGLSRGLIDKHKNTE